VGRSVAANARISGRRGEFRWRLRENPIAAMRLDEYASLLFLHLPADVVGRQRDRKKRHSSADGISV